MRPLADIEGVFYDCSNVPAFKCARLVNGSLVTPEYCAQEAGWHLIWNTKFDHGFCCDEHMIEAGHLWAFYAMHKADSTCFMPGARYDRSQNVCVVDEIGLGFSSVVSTVPAARRVLSSTAEEEAT